MHSMIQKLATPMVIFVKRSPAFVPNALCPPMPPKAPAKTAPLAALNQHKHDQKERR